MKSSLYSPCWINRPLTRCCLCLREMERSSFCCFVLFRPWCSNSTFLDSMWRSSLLPLRTADTPAAVYQVEDSSLPVCMLAHQPMLTNMFRNGNSQEWQWCEKASIGLACISLVTHFYTPIVLWINCLFSSGCNITDNFTVFTTTNANKNHCSWSSNGLDIIFEVDTQLGHATLTIEDYDFDLI